MFECCQCLAVLIDELMDDERGNLYCLECWGARDDHYDHMDPEPLPPLHGVMCGMRPDLDEACVNPGKEH